MKANKNGEVALSGEALATLAVERWRISQWLEKNRSLGGTAPLAYAARKIQAILDGLGVKAVDQTGEPYWPGSMLTVVYSEIDSVLEPGTEIIFETITPTVIMNKKLLRAGEIVTHTSGGNGEGGHHEQNA